jgi:hypothetical protein
MANRRRRHRRHRPTSGYMATRVSPSISSRRCRHPEVGRPPRLLRQPYLERARFLPAAEASTTCPISPTRRLLCNGIWSKTRVKELLRIGRRRSSPRPMRRIRQARLTISILSCSTVSFPRRPCQTSSNSPDRSLASQPRHISPSTNRCAPMLRRRNPPGLSGRLSWLPLLSAPIALRNSLHKLNLRLPLRRARFNLLNRIPT